MSDDDIFCAPFPQLSYKLQFKMMVTVTSLLNPKWNHFIQKKKAVNIRKLS